MRKPERFIGFVTIDELEVPYEFDEETFSLKCYFPTKEEAKEHYFDDFISLSKTNVKAHEFVENFNVKANLPNDEFVVFCIRNNPSSYCGYRTYSVNWYYYTSEENDGANGIRMCGREVDYFLPPHSFLGTQYTLDNTNRIQQMKIDVLQEKTRECGHFQVAEKNMHVTGSAITSLAAKSSVPIRTQSVICVECDNKLAVDELVHLVLVIKNFFTYISYRTNISVNSIDVFGVDEDGSRRSIGLIAFPKEECEETKEKASERIISYELLGEKSALIIQAIQDGEIVFRQFCKSITECQDYRISRITMILAAFEREFQCIYGQNVGRSEEFMFVKNEIIKKIEEYMKEQSGKRKHYAKQILNHTKKFDNSFGDKIKYALSDCWDCLEPFVKRRYSGALNEIIDQISARVNVLRNSVAHSSLDYEFEPIFFADIKVIEELIYVMRLKHISIDTICVRKCINQLFHENLGI